MGLWMMCAEHHLWICGDIHGELSNLVWKVTRQLKIRHADILIVGDFGAGFGRPKSMDAVSTDIDLVDPLTRKSRRMQNDALIKFGSSKRIWWSDEAPSMDLNNLPIFADIVVSHEAPLSFEPPLVRDDHVRDCTWQKVVESRRYLDFVLNAVKPSQWFYGHYHSHYEGDFQGTHYLGLDIAEMTQVC